jgi:hypothetical protein
VVYGETEMHGLSAVAVLIRRLFANSNVKIRTSELAVVCKISDGYRLQAIIEIIIK